MGSGLGLSIVQRVAALHGLGLRIDRLHAGTPGRGLQVRIAPMSAGDGGQPLPSAVA